MMIFARCVLVGCLVAWAARLPALAEKPSDRPNILFIFSDDHATAAIGAYGKGLNETPNIDRIAREGALFQNTFCANSICGPSRACILTGLHSHKNGFMRNGDEFDGSQFTFPKQLQKGGYRTALIGKWHLKSDPTGFDHWDVLPGQGNYYNPDFLSSDSGRVRHEGYVTDIITDKTLDWLRQNADGDQPFLMMCQHKAPHRNWSPAPRHLSMFDGEDLPVPETLFDDYGGRTNLLQQNEMSLERHFSWSHDAKLKGKNLHPEHFMGRHQNREYQRMTPEQRAAWDDHYQPINQQFLAAMSAGKMSEREITLWKYQRYIKDYLRCIAAVDESIGRLLKYLDESGLSDNTIVIYSSDQGFYLGEHGWYDKRWMFEPSLQMPMVVRWPGRIDPGARPQTMIQNIDFAPTFLEIAQRPIPDSIQGRSLVPVLEGDCDPTNDWRDAIYYAYYENGRPHNVPAHDGVRTSNYKLMFFPRSREYQLFDLQKDPDEMRSVHDDADYATIKQQLITRLDELREQYDVNTAVIPATRGDESRWQSRFVELNKRARETTADLVFLGDSITQGWEGAGAKVWQKYYGDRSTLNIGIGGDRTEHVLYRLAKGNFAGQKPKAVALLIGTNNTGHLMQSPQEVAEGVRAIVESIHEASPRTKILLHAIFPRGDDASDSKRLNNDAINRLIEPLSDDPRVEWIDISDRFLQPDGRMKPSLTNDQLHLTTAGYEVWASAIEPSLQRMLGEKPEAVSVR